jgi:rare lipoprotein A
LRLNPPLGGAVSLPGGERRRRSVSRLAVATIVLSLLAAPAGAEQRAHLFEEGLASWYGGKFHGRQTASGELFDKNAISAAHRTLPFGTVLLVTNLENGRYLQVRVNDRGPFVKGRVIDCSEAAAHELGFRGAGIARVRLEILGRVPEAKDSRLSKRQLRRLEKQLRRAQRNGRPVEHPGRVLVPVDPEEGPFTVQVGAFSEPGNARRLADRLAARGLFTSVQDRGDGLHRVRVGRHATRAEAERAAEGLRAEGLPTFLVRLDDAA